MDKTRRALVLVDESARHPFRRSLPPHVRAPLAGPPLRAGWLRLGKEDVKSFFAAYCACFVAVTAFIS